MNHDETTLIAQIGAMTATDVAVPVDLETAEAMAAFEEDALSPEEALASRFDDVAEDK